MVSGTSTGSDQLGETLDYCRLTDTRFSDQTRIILRSSAQDLDHPLNLLLPADHRIQLPSLASAVRSRL